MLRYKRNEGQGARLLISTSKIKRNGVFIMNMKKYFVYMDDGHDVYKVAVPAKDEKTVRAYVEGNGEVVAIKDVTSDYFISSEKVTNALKNSGFGSAEINFIIRALEECNITE